LIASRAQTIEAVSGLMNLVMMPMWLLSGIFFSSDRFPDVVRPFIKALPLTALNDALRSVMLEGRSVSNHPIELCILAAYAVVAFSLALWWFRWN
jgi:ABC-type polysaccharide/polyol phosphate export permease